MISSKSIRIVFWGSVIFVAISLVYRLGFIHGKQISDPAWIANHEKSLVTKASKEPLVKYGGDTKELTKKGVVVEGPRRFQAGTGELETNMAVVRVKIVGEPDLPNTIRVVGALVVMSNEDNIKIGDNVVVYYNAYYWEQYGYYNNFRFAVKEK